MKTKQIIIFLYLLIAFISCKKTEETPIVSPKPTTTTVSNLGCRIVGAQSGGLALGQSFVTTTYEHDKDGFISKAISRTNTNNNFATLYFYENGLLTELNSGNEIIENYEYSNGALSKIKIVKTDEKAWENYQINIETDANKRIIKMSDSDGFKTDIKRDDKGNLIELKYTRIKDNIEILRYEFSDYDNKKTIQEHYKGWQYDVEEYYGDYMITPTFSKGAGGNARNKKLFRGGSLDTEWQYTYQYTTDGFPTRKDVNNKTTNRGVFYNYSFADCK